MTTWMLTHHIHLGFRNMKNLHALETGAVIRLLIQRVKLFLRPHDLGGENPEIASTRDQLPW